MTMQLSQDAFDVDDAHPLAQSCRPQRPAGNRIGAILITLAAHIAVIVALATGINTVQAIHQPAVIMVHIDPEKKKAEELPLPPPSPALVKPTAITVPMPVVTIAQRPSVIAASPPAAQMPPVALSTPIITQPAPAYTAPTWQRLLLARLEQAKRYPPSAQAHRQQGVVMLRFAMDRDGSVITARIEKSSGVDVLDQETLALIQRAQPLPKPPPDVAGNPIELVVPIEFFLNNRR